MKLPKFSLKFLLVNVPRSVWNRLHHVLRCSIYLRINFQVDWIIISQVIKNVWRGQISEMPDFEIFWEIFGNSKLNFSKSIQWNELQVSGYNRLVRDLLCAKFQTNRRWSVESWNYPYFIFWFRDSKKHSNEYVAVYWRFSCVRVHTKISNTLQPGLPWEGNFHSHSHSHPIPTEFLWESPQEKSYSHSHPIPMGMGIYMGIPIPTATLTATDILYFGWALYIVQM